MMRRTVLCVGLLAGLASFAGAQSRASSGHSAERARHERPSFGGKSDGAYVIGHRRRTRVILPTPPFYGEFSGGPTIEQNVTVVSQPTIEVHQEASPQADSLRIVAVSGGSEAKPTCKPFQPVKPGTDERFRGLVRETSRISAAQLGTMSGTGTSLSHATLIALRASRSSEWTMVLCWEDADAFAAAHPGVPLQAWFQTADTAKCVVEIGPPRTMTELTRQNTRY